MKKINQLQLDYTKAWVEAEKARYKAIATYNYLPFWLKWFIKQDESLLKLKTLNL